MVRMIGSIQTVPPPVVEKHGNVWVVRDDLVPGGTKERVLSVLFDDKHEEYVYASPVQGYAQLALAYCCKRWGKKATVFCAARRERHPLTRAVITAGAKVVEVGPCGYLSVVTRRARDYCAETGAKLLPFGLSTPEIKQAISTIARKIAEPKEVWSVASSGTLTLALQDAWPNAMFHAVRVGAVRDVGRAKVWQAPERYEQNARQPPPFPSCPNYDAKAWQFIRQHAKPGALFWNVAG